MAVFEAKSDVDSYLGGEEIICLLCGRSFISIGHHVARSHSMSARDYKIKFGLAITKGISTEESKARWRQNIKKTRESGRLAEHDADFQRSRIAARPLPAAHAPRYASAERQLDPRKIHDILTLIKDGATLNAACKRAGVPSRTWLFNLLKNHKEFQMEWDRAWDSLPFPVQARCKSLGARFLATVEGLRNRGYTDAQIAEKTGVSEETCRRARHGRSRATEKGVCLKCGAHIGRGIKAHIKSCAGKSDVGEIDLTQQPSKKVLLKRAQKFEQALLRLQKFVERTGSAYASVLYVESDGFKLGAWISRQRDECKKGRLSPDQIAALEDLPGWTWRVVDAWWDDGILRLQKFVAREGDSRVPQDHVEPDGFKLGTWVSNRRAEYHAGRLSQDQIVVLESLPEWMWKSTLAWGDAFSKLQKFVEREGGAWVRQVHVEPDGFRLGKWVNHARYQYKKGRLSHDQIVALESLPGWTWRVRDVFTVKIPKIPKNPKIPKTVFRKFEDRFFCLQELVARTGSADISVSYVDSDGFRLGRWISSRRTEYHTGRLSEDRIAALEGLPGWRWVADPKTPTKQRAAQ